MFLAVLLNFFPEKNLQNSAFQKKETLASDGISAERVNPFQANGSIYFLTAEQYRFRLQN